MALATERQKGAHLLRRFGLGASEAELDYYLRDDGLEGLVRKLLRPDDVDEGFDLDVERLTNPQNGQLPPQAVTGWWTLRLLTTRRPLRERMTLFWHDHFATSAEKVRLGRLMHAQNETLRANALGRFGTLLEAVAKDPAMLLWLDNQTNVRGRPNENFAREVMELFTLGVDQGYTEADVKEAARAFTGWSLRRVDVAEAAPMMTDPGKPQRRQITAEYLFRPNLHDRGAKTVVGKSGPLTGEDVLAHLATHPRTAEHLVTKLWEWFGYAKPEPALVARLTKVFRDADLDLTTLLGAMMRTPEMFSERAERRVYKNPVDFAVVTARQLGVGEAVALTLREGGPVRVRLAPAAAVANSMRNMGMWLLYPPDVDGWVSGAGWVTSATMLERIAWGDRLFGQLPRDRFPVWFDAFALFGKDPTPEGVARKLVSVYDAPLPAARMASLAAAARRASGGHVTERNANVTAAAVTKLVFATPEFQFC